MTPKQREAREQFGLVVLVFDKPCVFCQRTGQPVHEMTSMVDSFICHFATECDQAYAAQRRARREDMPCP